MTSVTIHNEAGPPPSTGVTTSTASNSSTSASAQPAPFKTWGGRFTGKTDPVFESFNASISFDRAMWAADIAGSRAYAAALARAGTITALEADTLRTGLTRVADEWRANTFTLQQSDEDIHTANERRLGDFVGSLAGKLHTGRSRNDQVATDIRLYLLTNIGVIQQLLCDLVLSTTARAEAEVDLIIPGYTHLQPAQPVRFSHFLLSYVASWQRDADRLRDLTPRVSTMPLGSGALAGNPFGLDRRALANDLGFASISANSMDAVSDRDFIAEFLFFAALTMTHLSQLSEDLILWSSRRFVTLADAYSTGSSLMPQKKNPDALELLRGKTARTTGGLLSILSLLKALPRAYNKDLQEDKEPLFDAVLTLTASLQIMQGVITTLTLNREALASGLVQEMLATDLAEYLVRKGVPFRETHHVAGAAVRLAEERGVGLWDLTVHDLQGLHAQFQDDVLEIWDYERSVESRNVPGGTSRSSQVEQIAAIRSWAKQFAPE